MQLFQKIYKPTHITQLKLNLKQIKIECIGRGMDFVQVVESDFPTLNNWLSNNYLEPTDPTLVSKYDDFIDEFLTNSGKDYLVHPSLRLGFIGDNSDERQSKVISENKKNHKKSNTNTNKGNRREKDKNGIVKATKKSLTFKLQKKGFPFEKVKKRVLRRFPDANVKSLKIYFPVS